MICQRTVSSRSLYLSIRRAVKQIVIFIVVGQFVNCLQSFIDHPVVKVYCTCREICCVSLVWVLTQPVKY
jgi:hypothetical protein